MFQNVPVAVTAGRSRGDESGGTESTPKASAAGRRPLVLGQAAGARAHKAASAPSFHTAHLCRELVHVLETHRGGVGGRTWALCFSPPSAHEPAEACV